MNIRILSVDLQKDFSAPGGKHFHPHPNVKFIKAELLPFLRENGIKIAEIISDYRQPRPGDRDASCLPGTTGYESEIPADLKLQPVWVKCMNSPIWTRDGVGDASKQAGLPYEDTKEFGSWLDKIVGKAGEVDIVLIGLTIDCCVLCTAQELSMRGYKVFVLREGVDPYSGDQTQKQQILDGPILNNWAKTIGWEQLKQRLQS